MMVNLSAKVGRLVFGYLGVMSLRHNKLLCWLTS